MRNLAFIFACGLLMAGCAGTPSSSPAPVSASDLEKKINYVCAYSGDFKLVGEGVSLIPMPGLASAMTAAELAATEVCSNSKQVAATAANGEAVVADLIAKFKAVGKM